MGNLVFKSSSNSLTFSQNGQSEDVKKVTTTQCSELESLGGLFWASASKAGKQLMIAKLIRVRMTLDRPLDFIASLE
jgi:hypothetical protein